MKAGLKRFVYQILQAKGLKIISQNSLTRILLDVPIPENFRQEFCKRVKF